MTQRSLHLPNAGALRGCVVQPSPQASPSHGAQRGEKVGDPINRETGEIGRGVTAKGKCQQFQPWVKTSPLSPDSLGACKPRNTDLGRTWRPRVHALHSGNPRQVPRV